MRPTQANKLLRDILREIADATGAARVDDFRGLRQVDAKTREARMIIRSLPGIGESLARDMDEDSDFSMNSRRVPRAHRGALEPPNRGQDGPVPGNPARKGPRTRPQRPPGRLHPTSTPRRIRPPPPRPGSLRSPCRGGGLPLKSALLADACPPSRSPHRPPSACSASPNPPSSPGS